MRSRSKHQKFQGQFWFDEAFLQDGVILNQTRQITVPKEKYVQVVANPHLKAERHEEGGQKIYSWHHAHLEPTESGQKKSRRFPFTTFKNWEEVGEWWSSLAWPEVTVTPALHAKTNELTAGLASNTNKAKAIYAPLATAESLVGITAKASTGSE